MKKLLPILILLIFLVGCGVDGKKEVLPDENSRFTMTGQKFDIGGSGVTIYIVKDTETKVLYIWDNDYGNRGGLTPWLDENGKPMKSK